MTLTRQIGGLLAITLALVLIGILNVSLTQTRMTLAQQLNAHAQNLAHTIGLAITQTVHDGQYTPIHKIVADLNRIKTPHQVTVLINNTGELIQAAPPPTTIPTAIPKWFRQWQQLTLRPAEFAVTADWSILAWVYVKPEQQEMDWLLWQQFLNLGTWLILIWGGVVVIIILIVRWALAPLKQITLQATAIQQKEFGTLAPLPISSEFRQIAQAINELSATIKHSLDEQIKLAERLRIERDQDEVTQLGNRRYFDHALNRLLATSDNFLSGAVCLLELANFKAYNDKMGFAAGDDLLRRMATLLNEACQNFGDVTTARLGGGHFGILLQDILCEDAALFATHICTQMNHLYADGLVDSLQTGHIGLTCFVGKQSAAQLLAQADSALRIAQRQATTHWHRYTPSETPAPENVHNAREWLTILRNALDRREMILFYQPVVSIDNRQLLYHEVYARIRDAQQIVPAYLFIPMAERHGIIHELDRLIATSLFAALSPPPHPYPLVALNLSLQSIKQDEFVQWLSHTLSTNPELAHHLVFEIPEYGVFDHFAKIAQFSQAMRALGCQIALDNFGMSMRSFSYLNQLRPDYIKMDGSFTQNIHDNKNHQFFLQSIANVAHNLGITLIAQRVERQEEWKTLRQLQVDAIQGYLTGEPRLERVLPTPD